MPRKEGKNIVLLLFEKLFKMPQGLKERHLAYIPYSIYVLRTEIE